MSKIARFVIWICSKFTRNEIEQIINGLLYSGDIVLVDHSRNFVDPHGGIYAIVVDNEIMIKRIQVLYPQKKMLIISDNKDKYPPVEAEPEQVIINGKIIWFGREIER